METRPPLTGGRHAARLRRFADRLRNVKDVDPTVPGYLQSRQASCIRIRDAVKRHVFRRVRREGKHEIGAPAGQGAIGIIYNARDLDIRRRVAMKVLHSDVAESRQDVLRFVEEAQITSQLEHPNIIPVHELGVGQGGRFYYTMKFVRGIPLDEVLFGMRDGDSRLVEQFPLARLLTIFQKACDAVAFAHAQGVMHRDLKPENIMVGDFGEVLVMDWGLAKFLDETQAAGQAAAGSPEGGDAPPPRPAAEQTVASVRRAEGFRTVVGEVIGTPAFMAPEQARGRNQRVDARADVYALGGILYNILTLAGPVDGYDIDETLRRAARGIIPHPRQYNPDGGPSPDGTSREKWPLPHCPRRRVPESLAAVAMKALSLSRRDRHQTVQELQRDIEAYQEGFSTSAESAASWRTLGLIIRRNRRQLSLLAGAVLLAVLISAGFARWLRAETQRAERGEQEIHALIAQLDAERALQQRLGGELSMAEELARARDLTARSHWNRASEVVDEVLAQNARQVEAWCLKGQLELAALRFEAAAEALLAARELDPEALGLAVEPLFNVARRFADQPPNGELDFAKRHALLLAVAGAPPVNGVRVPLHGLRWSVPEVGVRLQAVFPGTFQMGSESRWSDPDGRERPPHAVALTRPFWVGITEVTQEQFRRFCQETGYRTQAERDDQARVWKQGQRIIARNANWRTVYVGDERPVVCVSWEDAAAMCQWLTDREAAAGRLPEGLAFRLPTEAEWEYCCRAGTPHGYSFGADPKGLYRYGNYLDAWYHDERGNAPAPGGTQDDGRRFPAPAGSYAANPWNLCDMHGNCSEWCADWYGSYRPTAATNPTGPRHGDKRVVRGGSWNSPATQCRSASRNALPQQWAVDSVGFRIVAAPSIPTRR